MSEGPLNIEEFIAFFEKKTGTLIERAGYFLYDFERGLGELSMRHKGTKKVVMSCKTEGIGTDMLFSQFVFAEDCIGQPDLSLKGINRFKGRWEGESCP